MLIITQIYAYIGAFLLAFGPILYHCSPQRAESPTTPRELRKTAKYKHNIGQTLQHFALVSHLKCKTIEDVRESAKKQQKEYKDDKNMLEKFSFFFGYFCTYFSTKRYKLSNNKQFKVFLHNSLHCRQCTRRDRVQVTSQRCMLKDTTIGFISIQTVCFLLWVDLYRVWTLLCMFWAGL